MAYGIPADLVDDHLAMGESQAIMCVKRFAVGIVQVFGEEYLRSPNAEDATRLLAMNKARGFPSMLGSIDCMHWSWKNCPKAWHGQFHGQKKGSTIILEAVADQETWIWHAFFGMPGSLNDINVVNRSPLMNKIANGELPPVQFVANGRTYNYGYYLADGIYPKWQTFVKPLKKSEGKKNLDFHNAQAAARKDVERAFGILQAQFAIVRGPARFWDQKMLWYI
uniref:DDE Tnp4 domain-containing protein n=2 Tax=Aegilops tauschii subsp. strangulata TaxID=200361 RepID=A0A453SSU8_AEGTS